MARKSPSPSDQLLYEQSLVRAPPTVAESSGSSSNSRYSIQDLSGVYSAPMITNELEIHLSRAWLREHVHLNLFRYINEPPLVIPLGSRNAITLASLRNLYPQKTEALVIQAYGSSDHAACHRCRKDSGLKKAFQYCTVLDDVAQGACGNCVWQHGNIRCDYHPSFTPSLNVMPTVEPSTASKPRSQAGRSSRVTRNQSRENSITLSSPYELPPLRRSALRQSAKSRRRPVS